MIDNVRVWNELNVLTVNGPAWSFIKSHAATMDGRAAVIALQQQNEGDSSMLVRRVKAYKILRDTVFSGPRKNWTFMQYVTAHQRAHNELADCGEALSDTKKVSDFLEGITDPTLASGLANVYGDTIKLSSFQACQQ